MKTTLIGLGLLGAGAAGWGLGNDIDITNPFCEDTKEYVYREVFEKGYYCDVAQKRCFRAFEIKKAAPKLLKDPRFTH